MRYACKSRFDLKVRADGHITREFVHLPSTARQEGSVCKARAQAAPTTTESRHVTSGRHVPSDGITHVALPETQCARFVGCRNSTASLEFSGSYSVHSSLRLELLHSDGSSGALRAMCPWPAAARGACNRCCTPPPCTRTLLLFS